MRLVCAWDLILPLLPKEQRSAPIVHYKDLNADLSKITTGLPLI